MGEVMLTFTLDSADAAQWDALTAALEDRRWTRLPAVPNTLVCYFENGFIAEVRRIVEEDLHKAARRAGVTHWHAAHAWSAIPPVVFDASVLDRPLGDTPPGDVDLWTDGGEPVGPVADVMLTVALPDAESAKERVFHTAIARRGWMRFEEVPTVYRHPFDLGMFDPIEPRVARDLAAAAAYAGIRSLRAAFSLSTFECECIAPPPPLRSRPLPWDER